MLLLAWHLLLLAWHLLLLVRPSCVGNKFDESFLSFLFACFLCYQFMSRAMSIKVGWCFITSPTCFVLKAVCSEPVLYYFSAMLGKNAIGLPCPAIHANFSLRSKEVGNRFVPFRTQEAMVFFFMPVVPSSSVFAKQVRTISHPNIKCLESWISPLVLLRLLKTLCAFWCSVFFFGITGPREVQGDWQRFPSQGRIAERNDLSFAVPFLLTCHILSCFL